MSDTRVIIFGCQAISIEILRYLSNLDNVKIIKLFTYEVPSDVSRGQESIIDVAKEMKINISSPSRISKAIVDEIIDLKPDLIISAYYRKIFPKELINIARLGIINIHPSVLPNYRGPVPTAWAILNGENEFGITIHQVDSGIDTGNILVQKKYNISDDETGYELYLRAMSLGAKLFIENFDDIVAGIIKPQTQKLGGSYFGKLKNRVLINWKDSGKNIRNQVRVRARPYNPIETILENKYFFINKVTILNNMSTPVQVPGKILKVNNDDSFIVSCADGALHIEEYSVYPPFEGVEKEIYLKPGRSFEDS
jgi:methionyl-tRNA formyltransferase